MASYDVLSSVDNWTLLRIMREVITEELLVSERSEHTPTRGVAGWRSAAMICFISGTFLGLSGLIMSLLSGLKTMINKPVDGAIESALIVSSLVFLILGAHCLDRIREIRKRDIGEKLARRSR